MTANYAQGWLFPPTLEELVPADHPARFLRDLVRTLDLSALGLAPVEPGPGRPTYAPALLLSVWLYGYFLRIYSARALEAACYDHLGMLWLAGGHHPDHNTLWRFVKANRAALKALFRQSVQVAHHCGLIGLVLHAVDGTKLEAACSRRTSWRQAALTRALARLEAQIEETLATIEATGAGEAATLGLPERLHQAEARRDAIAEALALVQAAHREEVHPAEPDAQRMVTNQGTTTLAYNAQAVVESTSGLLVAAEVTTAPSDNVQLPALLAAVQETLGGTAATTVADGGYYSGEALAAAEAAGHTVLVNDRAGRSQTGPYAKAQFTYEAERDGYRCPQGEFLPFVRERRKSGKPYWVRVYRCRCHACPVHDACTRNRQGREIEQSPADVALARHAARVATPEGRALLAQRGCLIERVFADLKQVRGFRRFTWRGLAGAQGQWALVATVFNLRKLYTRWQAHAFNWG